MEKYYNDKGEVAVLVSGGFGAGWSTWVGEGRQDTALFHPKFVVAALNGVQDIEPIAEEVFGDDDSYTGGWKGVRVCWLKPGTKFYVDECDGAESLVLPERMEFREA